MGEPETPTEEGPTGGEKAETSAGEPPSENGSSDLTALELPSDVQGHKLDEMGGAQVGRIESRVSGGQTEWLLARMGRFGHYCLVPGRDAVAANGRVWVPYTRDQIRRAPRVEPQAPLDAESEQNMLEHYGLA
jgi:hypothetical protein